jgi:hypothetical protein
MKFLSKIILIFALTVSCGTEDLLYPAPSNASPELYPYYLKFIQELASRKLVPKRNVRQIVWTDKDLGQDVIGTCETWESTMPRLYTYRIVRIKREGTGEVLDRLVFHELGHCMLDLSHSCDGDDIMYPHVVSPLTKESVDAMFDDYARGETYEECDENTVGD